MTDPQPANAGDLFAAVRAGIGTEYLKYCDEANEAADTLEARYRALESENAEMRAFVEQVANYLPSHEPKYTDRHYYYTQVAESDERVLYHFERLAVNVLAGSEATKNALPREG